MIPATLNRILVPTDFSDTAGHALQYASDLARRLGAGITVLYSDPFVPPIDFSMTAGGWDAKSLDELQRLAKDELHRDARTNIHRSVRFDTVVRIAMPREGILDQARESGAGLIVMGTHGRTGFRRLIIGSVTESVMRHAQVPVLAVPPRSVTTSSITTVVCPITDSAQCRDALLFAARITPPDARFIVIRTTGAQEAIPLSSDLFELRALLPEAIATRCELKIFSDDRLASQIVSFAAASRAGMIVVSEPAGRRNVDALLGTFAERLLQRSGCPVLKMNGPTATISSFDAQEEAQEELVGVSQ